jgi:hypothetical protein
VKHKQLRFVETTAYTAVICGKGVEEGAFQ